MTLEVRWHPAARRRLEALDWHDAARLDGAVQRFARSGRGEVRRMHGDGAAEYRLYFPPFYARISVEREARILHVWWIGHW